MKYNPEDPLGLRQGLLPGPSTAPLQLQVNINAQELVMAVEKLTLQVTRLLENLLRPENLALLAKQPKKE